MKLSATYLQNIVEDTSPQLGGNLDLNGNDITGTGNISITQASTTEPALTLTSTDDGTVESPTMRLVRNSASQADADQIGQIEFYGKVGTSAIREYAGIKAVLNDVSPSSHDGQLDFYTRKNSAETKLMSLTPTALELTNGTDLDVAGDITVGGTVDGVDIATRDALLTSTTTTANSAMQDLVDDTTPQLGGGLDLNGNNITGTGIISTSSAIGTTNGNVGTTNGNLYTSSGHVEAREAEIGSGKTGSFDDNYSTGINSSGSSTKVVDIGTGYHNGGTTTINIGPTSTTTTKTINLNANVNVAGNLLPSAPISSKHTFSTTSTQNITTTAPVTIYEPDIPAPAGGNEATQSLNAVVRVRFYNSSSSAVKENHQWKIPVAIKSKTNVGTSLGTATFSSSPSPYNAWYYVSGDKTSMFASNRGGFSTNTTGANAGSFAGVYYDSVNDRTYLRVSKYPDATTVYNGVEVFYSTVNFASSGTFVNDLGFNNNYLTIGSTTAYQTVEFPLVFTFGRSTTATEVRIQFDHVSSTTNLSTVVTGICGYVENTV